VKNIKSYPLSESEEDSLIGDLRELGFNDLKGYLIQTITESYYGWYIYIAKDEAAVVDMILWEPSGLSGQRNGPPSPIWANHKPELKRRSPKTIQDCLRFAMGKDELSFYSIYTDLPVSKDITAPHWAVFSGFDPYETIRTFGLYFEGDISSILGKDSDFDEHFDEGQWKPEK